MFWASFFKKERGQIPVNLRIYELSTKGSTPKSTEHYLTKKVLAKKGL